MLAGREMKGTASCCGVTHTCSRYRAAFTGTRVSIIYV